MAKSRLKAIYRPIKNALRKHRDRFLNDVSGVVHVGANTGQERDYYKEFGLCVIWVEPIPEVFAELKDNIRGYNDQRAFQALLTDIDGGEYQFHIANNGGASSSILNLKQHKDIWPDVAFTTTISLNSTTLASLFRNEQIDAREYQALIMDTQGSELSVLHGSVPILDCFKYIKTEVPDFEAYEECSQLADIDEFMAKHGYIECACNKFASRPAGGNYYDIVYRRTV